LGFQVERSRIDKRDYEVKSLGFGSRVKGSGLRVQGSGLMFCGVGVEDFGSRVQGFTGLGFRV
jgi:hypothetical protein